MIIWKFGDIFSKRLKSSLNTNNPLPGLGQMNVQQNEKKEFEVTSPATFSNIEILGYELEEAIRFPEISHRTTNPLKFVITGSHKSRKLKLSMNKFERIEKTPDNETQMLAEGRLFGVQDIDWGGWKLKIDVDIVKLKIFCSLSCAKIVSIT